MKVFSFRLKELSIFLFMAVIGVAMVHTIHREKQTVTAMLPTSSKTIIIDAGHGGWDPGKTGSVGENEKMINLSIALKLQMFLEQGGANVSMTRNTDEALGEKKQADMKERKAVAKESDADIFVSIHQNSFPKADAKGAQVFYHKSSPNGKLLAEMIQSTLKEYVDPDNTRVAKDNTSYYILKNTEIPAAIVECGFLSNREEEQLLNDEKYQEKIAWAIYMGIMDYFEQVENTVES